MDPTAAGIVAAVLPYLIAVALLASVLRLFAGRRTARAAAAVLALAVFIPVGDLTVAGYLRVFTDALSVVSIVLLLSVAIGPVRGRPMLDRRDGAFLLLAAGALAIVLYPTALGFTGIDLYRWGYGAAYLPALVAVIVVGACLLGRYGAAIVLLIAVIGFHLRILLSPNLWDYLTDPYLPVAAVVYLIVRAIRSASRREPVGTS